MADFEFLCLSSRLKVGDFCFIASDRLLQKEANRLLSTAAFFSVQFYKHVNGSISLQ